MFPYLPPHIHSLNEAHISSLFLRVSVPSDMKATFVVSDKSLLYLQNLAIKGEKSGNSHSSSTSVSSSDALLFWQRAANSKYVIYNIIHHSH